jgi:uncharacterized membrane protein YidH (DUF202 family)
MLRDAPDESAHIGSTLIGVGLVMLGSAAMVLAAWHHLRFCRTLPASRRPPYAPLHWTVAFAAVLAAVGAALAAYLVTSSKMI